jgi:hypothetical protein
MSLWCEGRVWNAVGLVWFATLAVLGLLLARRRL